MKVRGSFISGVITTLIVLALGTTVLAVSGNISFNFSNIVLDGETEISAGSYITASNGQQVPASILYTDTAGGGTNYLPLRTISELLGIEVNYDATTKTVYIGEYSEIRPNDEKRWKKEINKTTVTYFCEEDWHTYTTPLTFRPTFEDKGWGLANIDYDANYYTTTWEFNGSGGTITLHCANPSTAGFGRHMNSADAIENCQVVTVQGCSADYYEDGSYQLLVWENQDGILFYMSGKDVSKDLLVSVANTVKPVTADLIEYTPGWIPNGYSLLEHYEIADTVQTYWKQDGVALSLTYSGYKLADPDWDSTVVEINDFEGKYWEAKESPVGTNNESSASTAVIIPGVGSKTTNTLTWKDLDTGIYFRLQGSIDKDTMIHIAEAIRRN